VDGAIHVVFVEIIKREVVVVVVVVGWIFESHYGDEQNTVCATPGTILKAFCDEVTFHEIQQSQQIDFASVSRDQII